MKVDAIKDYIKLANETRNEMRAEEHAETREIEEAKKNQVRFFIDDITRLLYDLENEMAVRLDDVSDEEIIRRKSGIKQITRKMDAIASKIPQMLIHGAIYLEADKITKRYKEVTLLLNNYIDQLEEKADEREIQKESLFQESMLNIKIGKFNGYNSVMDVYTFQDKFEKVYSRSTPTRLLPDLLKNNHLDEPAFSLVRSVDSISEIWNRLKMAYGDPKIMLNKKLQDLYKFDALWKLKDGEKIVEALSRIINTMKDLAKISNRHNIESKLHNGDAVERIYKMMGDGRITRWLASIGDEEVEDAELWEKLIQFLERDLKIQH